MQASEKLDRPLSAAAEWKPTMETAGFQNVEEDIHQWPTNGWPEEKTEKEIGHLSYISAKLGLRQLTYNTIGQAYGWSVYALEDLSNKALKGLEDGNIHACWQV